MSEENRESFDEATRQVAAEKRERAEEINWGLKCPHCGAEYPADPRLDAVHTADCKRAS